MSRRYTHTLSLSIGGDTPTWEGEATVSYEVNPEEPEVGPTYAHGGLPRVPAEVVDVTVTHIDGLPITKRGPYGALEAQTIETHIECSDRLMDELLQAACEDAAADADEAAERAYEARREMARETDATGEPW